MKLQQITTEVKDEARPNAGTVGQEDARRGVWVIRKIGPELGDFVPAEQTWIFLSKMEYYNQEIYFMLY